MSNSSIFSIDKLLNIIGTELFDVSSIFSFNFSVTNTFFNNLTRRKTNKVPYLYQISNLLLSNLYPVKLAFKIETSLFNASGDDSRVLYFSPSTKL